MKNSENNNAFLQFEYLPVRRRGTNTQAHQYDDVSSNPAVYLGEFDQDWSSTLHAGPPEVD